MRHAVLIYRPEAAADPSRTHDEDPFDGIELLCISPDEEQANNRIDLLIEDAQQRGRSTGEWRFLVIPLRHEVEERVQASVARNQAVLDRLAE